MKQKGYQTNAEYIESMMKQFKLVDMCKFQSIGASIPELAVHLF